MDTLSQLLRDVCPRGASFRRTTVSPPWSRQFETGAPLTLLAIAQGAARLSPADGAPADLRAGTVVLALGTQRYALGDAGGDGSAEVLTGTFTAEGSLCDRILGGLPPLLVVRTDAVTHLLELVTAELAEERPGRQAILDHLLGLLLVTALRDWLARPESDAPPWYHAQHDPVTGVALRLMHADPAHPWSVGELARRAAVSRATFARRFADLVGEPPMAYLTCWRICLAADLLEHTDDTVNAIARRVGYTDADALSVAFKRVRGIRPVEHRAAQRRATSLPATATIP
ncbi:AraC family transcriptional regulator [Prauserella sp. PE36]|nr:AraC family transcriptional regulator [Prauserella sp. PE36]